MTNPSFHIDVTRPAERQLHVRASWRDPSGDEVEFFLPTWTPGSYLLREYARHLSRVRAFVPGTDRELPCEKTAKNRWLVRSASEGVELRYRVYAHELTVRTADVDAHHAYWNHTCLLLWPVGQQNLGCEILVDHPRAWRLSCSLPTEVDEGSEYTRCKLTAPSMDEALDAPVLIGETHRIEWQVDAVPHAIELDDNHAMAFSRRGISYYHRRKYADAHRDLKEAKSRDASIPGLQRYIQMTSRKLKRPLPSGSAPSVSEGGTWHLGAWQNACVWSYLWYSHMPGLRW